MNDRLLNDAMFYYLAIEELLQKVIVDEIVIGKEISSDGVKTNSEYIHNHVFPHSRPRCSILASSCCRKRVGLSA